MSPLWLSGPRRPPPAWVSCSCVHRAHPPRFTSRVPTDPSGSGGPGHSHDRSRHAFLFAVLFYIPASTRRSQQNPRRRASFPNLIVVKWHFHFALTFFFFFNFYIYFIVDYPRFPPGDTPNHSCRPVPTLWWECGIPWITNAATTTCGLSFRLFEAVLVLHGYEPVP